MSALFQFWRDERGQDLIEYTLLIMFIAVASVTLMASGQPSTNATWAAANSRLSVASDASGRY